MLFYEPLFLFVFFPAVLAAAWYFRHSAAARIWTLLIASILFYSWGEPAFVPVVLISALLDFVLARWVARQVKAALILGVSANLGVLICYKYLGFLTGNLHQIAMLAGMPPPPVFQMALPIGVSFVVFEKITYIVDVWRGRSLPARRFSRYLTYVFFFPKLLAGPIIKYHEIEEQFRDPHPPTETMVLDGFGRFMLGVIKKTLIADTIAPTCDAIFALPLESLSFTSAWAAVLLFTIQIYVDFSAYSDMAIGLAGMLGFRLNENFDYPYVSTSMTEFWRRWHISLTSWIREYLYLPLGGNRVAPWRHMANLWICFLASGLWHGAAWNFVLWGVYNGLFLVLDRLFLFRVVAAAPRPLAHAFTMLVVMLGWALFRCTSLVQLAAFLGAMSRPGLRGPELWWDNTVIVATIVGCAICWLPMLPWFGRGARTIIRSRTGRLCLETAGLVCFLIAVDKTITEPFRPFLYFRF